MIKLKRELNQLALDKIIYCLIIVLNEEDKLVEV